MVICIDVGELWQCAEENKVGDCQVEEVNIATLPLRQTKYITEYNQKIAKETNEELDGVEWCNVVDLKHIVQLSAIECLHRSEMEKRQQKKGK